MKSYVISVSLGTGCYRHIQISTEATLFELHKAILAAFELEDNRAHVFFMDDRMQHSQNVYCSYKAAKGMQLTKNFKLEQFSLQKGGKFSYLFDDLVYRCKVLKEIEAELKHPKTIRKVGQIPEDYRERQWDEDAEGGFPELYSEATILTLYENISLPRKTILRIGQYFQAAASLYGILSVRELLELYNSQNKSVSQEDFLAVTEVLRHSPHEEYEILGEEVFFSDVPKAAPTDRQVIADYLLVEEDSEAYVSLVNKQEGIALKILPAEEFLLYADPFYTRKTKESVAMLKYLQRKAKSLKVSPETMCELLQSVIEVDCPLDEVLGCMESEGWYFDSRDDILAFMERYQELNNHTRKHSLRGHTPAELFDPANLKEGITINSTRVEVRPNLANMPSVLNPQRNFSVITPPPLEQLSLFDEPQEKPRLTLVGKPSRNAPCPCGSGRKYKNCCGKNDK